MENLLKVRKKYRGMFKSIDAGTVILIVVLMVALLMIFIAL